MSFLSRSSPNQSLYLILTAEAAVRIGDLFVRQNKMRKIILLLSLLFLGCSKQPDVATIASSYQTYSRITEQPHEVSPAIARLCIHPTQEILLEDQQKSGPHSMTKVHIYMNPVANQSFNAGSILYPVGSVIIKEKIDYSGNTTGIGGMVKRSRGFDSKAGDWEYFYTPAGHSPTLGQIKSCVDCHAGAKQTDYVFGNWKPNKAEPVDPANDRPRGDHS